MSRRNKVLPLIPSAKKIESKPIPVSDASKLVWKEVMEPLTNAANAFNVAFALVRDKVVREMASKDSKDVTKFVLNMDTLEWVPRDNTPSVPNS